MKLFRSLVTILTLFILNGAMPVWAADPMPDKGDTAWMIVATLLVVMMAAPGLGLFYGGMVRTKNIQRK